MYDCAGPWTAYGQLNSPIFWDQHDPAPWECQPGGSVDSDTANIFLQMHAGTQLNMGTPFYGYRYTNINQVLDCVRTRHGQTMGLRQHGAQQADYGTDYEAADQPERMEHGVRSDRAGAVHAEGRRERRIHHVRRRVSTYYRVWYSGLDPKAGRHVLCGRWMRTTTGTRRI